jgi:hypothetical protein
MRVGVFLGSSLDGDGVDLDSVASRRTRLSERRFHISQAILREVLTLLACSESFA